MQGERRHVLIAGRQAFLRTHYSCSDAASPWSRRSAKNAQSERFHLGNLAHVTSSLRPPYGAGIRSWETEAMPEWLKSAPAYISEWLTFQIRMSEQPGCIIAIASAACARPALGGTRGSDRQRSMLTGARTGL